MRRWPRTPTELRLATEVVVTVQRMRLVSRHGRIRQLLARHSTARRSAAAPAPERDRALELAADWLDAWLARFPTNDTGSCYARALSLYAIARRRGLPVSFALGVRRDGDAVHAHAWLRHEEDGEAVLERSEGWRDYALCFAYPEALQR